MVYQVITNDPISSVFRPWLPVTQVTGQGTCATLTTLTVMDGASPVSTILTRTGMPRYIFSTICFTQLKWEKKLIIISSYVHLMLLHYYWNFVFGNTGKPSGIHIMYFGNKYFCFCYAFVLFVETRWVAADLSWRQKCGSQSWTSLRPAAHLLVWPQEPTWS